MQIVECCELIGFELESENIILVDKFAGTFLTSYIKPYIKLSDNTMSPIKFCPFCGKQIEVI